MENIVKGWFTSLLGAALMAFAFYGWWIETKESTESIIAAICGFALLFMKDKISVWIGELWTVLKEKLAK